MNRKTIWIIVGVVAALALCAAACLIVLLVTGLGAQWFTGAPTVENIEVQFDVPATVDRGSVVTLWVYVQNTASTQQTLDSIDIDTSYLDGMAIVSTDPAYSDTLELPLVSMKSLTFDRVIAANSTLGVEFTVMAMKTGNFSGTFDVCINDGSACQSYEVQTLVQP
jgi:hypothetical protein